MSKLETPKYGSATGTAAPYTDNYAMWAHVCRVNPEPVFRFINRDTRLPPCPHCGFDCRWRALSG